MFGGGAHGIEAYLLDLNRHHVRATRQVDGGVNIVEGSSQATVYNESRRTSGIGIKHLNAIAERSRGHGGHAAKLATTENADGRAGQNCRSHISLRHYGSSC